MKEKILQLLKAACGENTTTTEITLNKWADYLAAKITDESQLPAEIEALKPILTTYDGNMNFVVAREVKKIKDAMPTNPPAPAPGPTPPPTDKPAWFTEWEAKQEKETAELKGQLTAFQKERLREAMVVEAKAAFFKKYRVSESEKGLFEKALAIELRLNDHDTTDKLVDGLKTQFEELRTAVGLGSIEPVAANGGVENKDKPMLRELKQKLQKEGKIPIPATPSTT